MCLCEGEEGCTGGDYSDIPSPSVTQSDFAEFSKALEDCGADLRPLHYLKKWK